jgi:hypothetical protein
MTDSSIGIDTVKAEPSHGAQSRLTIAGKSRTGVGLFIAEKNQILPAAMIKRKIRIEGEARSFISQLTMN